MAMPKRQTPTSLILTSIIIRRQHEAPLPWPGASGSDRRGLARRRVSGRSQADQVPLAPAEALLYSSVRRACPGHVPFPSCLGAALLQPESSLENQLVPEGFRL